MGSGRVTAVDTLIVGAGFSGLCMAARLADVGLGSFVILEKADSIGGTWRDNHYPGCACDIPAHLYSLSFAPNPDWSHMFAPQPEILAYLRQLAASRNLQPRIRLGCALERAEWDEAKAVWCAQASDGTRYAARTLVSALGALHHPLIPALPGLERFRGERFHSAAWNHGYELSGKRVAVIGSGASAIQFVPQIVSRVERLHLFQRSPPWILPRLNPAFDARRRWLFRHLPLYRRWFRARLFMIHEQRYAAFAGNPALMRKIEGFARGLLERQVRDPALRARLTPDYAIGCKRLLISSDWYPALQQPNAEVVTEAIAGFGSHSILSADGRERPIDALIFGTGFDTQHNLSRLQVIGRNGLALAQAWREGQQGYLGTLVAGFPNLFVLLGPNSGLAHNSQLLMIEAQVRYILSSLKLLRRRGAASLEVRPQVQQAFNHELGSRLARMVWHAGCRNWYRDNAGHNTVNWPGSSLEYGWRTRRAAAADLHLAMPRQDAGIGLPADQLEENSA